MTIQEASEYFLCMDILKSREAIELNRATTWPHMKKEDRSRLHKKLLKDADVVDNKLRAATVQDIARIIGK